MKNVQFKVNLIISFIVIISGLYFLNNNAYGSSEESCVLSLECVEYTHGVICCGVCQTTGEISSCAFHPIQQQ